MCVTFPLSDLVTEVTVEKNIKCKTSGALLYFMAGLHTSQYYIEEMTVYNNIEDLMIQDKPAIALGSFDGMHPGRMAVLESAVYEAR